MTNARLQSTHAAPNAEPRSQAAVVWMRLLWATLFLGHLPAVFAVLSRPETELVRAALLLVSQLFFVLKALDVAWLRLPDSRRARTALVLIAVLLHADVLSGGSFSQIELGLTPEAAVVLQSVAAAAVIVLLTGYRPGWEPSEKIGLQSSGVGDGDRHVPRFLALLRSIGLQRPPPRCAH